MQVTFVKPSGRKSPCRCLLSLHLPGIHLLAGGHRSSSVSDLRSTVRSRTLGLFCIDNVAAEHALQKGCSKEAKFRKLLGAFWSWVAAKSLSLSFHRVTSAANASVGICRGDLFVSQELGCQQEQFPFDRAYKSLRALKDRALQRELALRGLGEAPPHPLKHAHGGGNSSREWLKSRCSA